MCLFTVCSFMAFVISSEIAINANTADRFDVVLAYVYFWTFLTIFFVLGASNLLLLIVMYKVERQNDGITEKSSL